MTCIMSLFFLISFPSQADIAVELRIALYWIGHGPHVVAVVMSMAMTSLFHRPIR